MRKAQSLVIQFIIFFTIGFSLFVVIGSFFRYQSDKFRYDIAGLSVKLTNKYLSSFAINSIDTCKQCDSVETYIKLENSTAGYFFQADLSSQGLNVSTMPEYESFISSIYNLNESSDMSGEAVSAKTINLTFTRTKNKLEVS